MSSSKRTRPQKHQNSTAWKANKFKTDPKTKLLEAITVTNCCAKCTEVIEWKIKYGKYKPLTQPTKCTKCLQKRVKSAYQVLCIPCVEEFGLCAKCGQKSDIVNEVAPSVSEKAKLDAEFQQELKGLPERKRRTLLRELRKGDNPTEGIESEEDIEEDSEEEQEN